MLLTLPPWRKFGLYLQDLVHILHPLCSLPKMSPAASDVPISLFPQGPLHNCVKAHSTITLKMCVYLTLSLIRQDSLLIQAGTLSCCPTVIAPDTEYILRKCLLN